MIKFTIILIIVYFVFKFFTKVYVEGLEAIDVLRLHYKNYNTGELIWFCLLGLVRLACIISGAISAILLVVKYL